MRRPRGHAGAGRWANIARTLLLGLALALLFGHPMMAQEEAQFDESPAGGEADASDEAATTDFEQIDDILAEDEEVLAGFQTYAYDPGTRRDPFRSLLLQSGPNELPEGERPDGVAGLLIDEILIEGVYVTGEGPVAQVQTASDETSYLLRPGDQLWDGDVVSISLQEVIFKQSINDPTALKPFRDVVKRLSP